MVKKVRLAQVAYKSEWALAKFFAVLKDNSISKRFDLTAICGRQRTKEEAFKALIEEISSRAELLYRRPEWRGGNRLGEIRSALSLLESLAFDGVNYFSVNGNQTLQEEVYKKCDAVVIHSTNTSHLGYLKDAVANRTHVLCEKPLVPLINSRGEVIESELSALEKLVDSSNAQGLVLMDAEHYSYKEPSLVFYEHLPELLTDKKGKKRKIKRIEGMIKERDDPEFERTREILSVGNGTGLLGDTMCHLLAFISNLGADSKPTHRESQQYSGFDVDTYDHARYTITGREEYFREGAEADFTVAKFIHKFQKPEEEESKLIKLVLDDDTEIELNFRDGTVKKRENGEEREYVSRYVINNNEYVNILNHFYAAIQNKSSPLTDFRNSIRTLRAILESYQLPSEKNIRVEVYQNDSN